MCTLVIHNKSYTLQNKIILQELILIADLSYFHKDGNFF